MTEIKQRLEKMRIAAPGYGRRGGKVKRTVAHKWYLCTISGILHSTTYKGQWRFGRQKESPALIVDVPPIVTNELFEAAPKAD